MTTAVNQQPAPKAGGKRKRKAKRRLFDIEVQEISVVNSPCVPAAEWVILKREPPPADSSGDLFQRVASILAQRERDRERIKRESLVDAIRKMSPTERQRLDDAAQAASAAAAKALADVSQRLGRLEDRAREMLAAEGRRAGR